MRRRYGIRWTPRRAPRWAAAGAGLLLVAGLVVSPAPTGVAATLGPGGVDVDAATIPQLQDAMDRGKLTSVALTRFYLDRIRDVDRRLLHAVLATNPDALGQARASDARRAKGSLRGPLDGIPVLLKDNINTGGGLPTTAGSLALAKATPEDAFIVGKLNSGGAVLIGKANLSEWANFRSTQSSSGWSAVGGQTGNPYALDHNPCGSSSGSGAGVAADLATVAIGTETDGSIVCPSGANGIVGVKPTLGRVSRTGIVPISAAQDTAGPMTRNVTDAAVSLAAVQGADPADPPTQGLDNPPDYTRFLDAGALRGARIGVWRAGNTGLSNETDAIVDRTVDTLRERGATVADPADLEGIEDVGGPEFDALLCEFKHDLNAYLAATPGDHPRTLAELIAFNEANAAREMPFFGQELFEAAQATSGDLSDPACADPRRTATSLARQAIDRTLAQHDLDAIIAPTGSPAWPTDVINGDHFVLGTSTPAAVSGYPSITVPAGTAFGLPVGVSLIGPKASEPELFALAYAFEQATHIRKPPRLARSAPANDGIRPWPPRGAATTFSGPDGSPATSGAPAGPAVPGTRQPYGTTR
ncbi:MAG: amidase [Streptosporangiales bacterium]|nr:amidase [Streptosporangiales bacterium]